MKRKDHMIFNSQEAPLSKMFQLKLEQDLAMADLGEE